MAAIRLHNGWSYGGHLEHFGIKGQQWGIRRYQNEDGTLTEEGRRRYLELNPISADIYNKAADKANVELDRINKKYRNTDLNDDRANLEYTREVRDSWQKIYKDVLAKDLEVNPSTLEGQKWLKDLIGYSKFDEELSELENKVKRSEKEKSGTSIGSSKSSSKSSSSSIKVQDYSNKKMNQQQAINQAYTDLEKQIPNFGSLPIDKQDELFFNYLNSSGLYKWV